MKFKKFALMTAVTAGLALTVTSCGSNDNGDGYTYHTYTTALGQNWNPHAWESNAESTMLSFILSPLVDISIKDSSKGLYQWVYEMATEVTDVTAQHQNDLTKYGAKLPKGKTASEITSDYVYEIKLNEDTKWETGENINADTYIDSMKLL